MYRIVFIENASSAACGMHTHTNQPAESTQNTFKERSTFWLKTIFVPVGFEEEAGLGCYYTVEEDMLLEVVGKLHIEIEL